MKIINFSVTTVANWMVYFYYMKTQCYKLKLFIFNASENETLSCRAQPSVVHFQFSMA